MWLDRLFGSRKHAPSGVQEGSVTEETGVHEGSMTDEGVSAAPQPEGSSAEHTPLPGAEDKADPHLSRDGNGRLRPRGEPAAENGNSPEGAGESAPKREGGAQNGAGPKGSAAAKPPARPAPDTSALNQKIVQAVQFANYENTSFGPDMVITPPDLMAGQAAGLAVQDAANYMNAIMQIAVAAQAVALKKAAEGPVQAVEEIPLLLEIQKMVSGAVEVYGNVATTAGKNTETFISDINSSES
ncbi:hypothetical protein [Roseibium sp. RKSG952]|uniref:hypothetical protein n=1 Tax=Roseibium sp. RKSG952 TaxID=2529384 RepID=UPI0012BC9573|nr:hypothetical protein [Roseibium sp. RKSG952]MTH95138.1 hypothetical protein [Roseibium sp. RKSG952]